MRRKIVLAAAFTAISVTLLGCEQLNHSIYREPSAGRGISVITDAKQRVLLRAEVGPEGQPPSAIYCAEPSPDVAQAIAQAFSLAANASRALPVPTDATGSNQSGLGISIGSSSAASVAQLGERLATIQLLRDKMYRACEAYANGAVGATGYTLMLARLDKTMATLLSNEMAAGAFGRALALTGASASAGGGASPEAVEKARKDVKDRADELAKADDAKRPDAARALELAVAKLVALEGSVAASATGASGTSVGGISGRTGTVSAADIASIHRGYLDDDGIEPLIDACITSMEAGDRQRSQALRDAAESFRKDRADRISNAKDEVGFAEKFRQSATDELGRMRNFQIELRGRLDLIPSDLRKDSNPEYVRIAGQTKMIADDIGAQEAAIKRYEEQVKSANERLKGVENAQPPSYDDRVTEAYLSAGLTFPAFCHRAVFADTAPFVKARLNAKRDLRAMEGVRDPHKAVCAALMSDDEFRKYVREKDKAKVPSGVQVALKTYCEIEIK